MAEGQICVLLAVAQSCTVDIAVVFGDLLADMRHRKVDDQGFRRDQCLDFLWLHHFPQDPHSAAHTFFVGLHPYKILSSISSLTLDFLKSLLTARDHPYGVTPSCQQNAKSTANLGSGSGKHNLILRLGILSQCLPNSGSCQGVAMHNPDLAVSKKRQQLFSSLVDELSLVEVSKAKVFDSCIVCVSHCLRNHFRDLLPVRLHEIEVPCHRQAPRGTLCTAVLVALNARSAQAVAAEQDPQEGQGLQRDHPPALLMLVGGEKWREPWHVQHGVRVVSMSQKNHIQRARLLGKDLSVESVGRRVYCAAQVVPNRTKKAIVVLVLAVVE